MRTLVFIVSILLLLSCSETTKPEKASKEKVDLNVNPEDLVKIDGDHFMEYYPDGKTLKFEGYQDDQKERHGKWVFYGEDGKELSMTMFDHGKKHGHSIVRYAHGGIHYHGEYHYDQKIGIWKSYDVNGKLIEEKDFGPAKK